MEPPVLKHYNIKTTQCNRNAIFKNNVFSNYLDMYHSKTRDQTLVLEFDMILLEMPFASPVQS